MKRRPNVMFVTMNTAAPDLIFSSDGFANRPELVAHAEVKAAKLLRHLHPKVAGVRVHVKHDAAHFSPYYFAVCATAETAGADHVAHAASSEPRAAINAAFDKLERSLTAAAGMRKHNERNIRSEESGVEFAATGQFRGQH
jgi:ribosome-associated translation inhibitor RaiA